MFSAVSEHAEPRSQAEARQRLAEIEAEVAKGKQADDSRGGGLLDGLAALVSTSASPLLAAAVGPVTRFVLGKLQSS